MNHLLPGDVGLSFKRLGCSLIAMAMIAMLGGCQRPIELATYDVVKPRRMLVAVLLDDARDTAWFFKIEGPTNIVDRNEAKFDKLLESVSLDESSGDPSWTVPEGWQETEAGSIQFAALAVDDSQVPVKLSVTRLGMGESEDRDSYLLRNLNRWRAQLGLDRIDTLPDDGLTEVTVGDLVVARIDLYGRKPDGASDNALGANRPNEPRPSGGPGMGFDIETPEGWEQGASTGFSVVSMKIRDGEKTAAVTVSPLTAASSWESNVERWVGIVGADPMTNEQIAEATEKFTIAESEGEWIDLQSKEGVAPANRLIAIRIVKGQTAWFVRFSGDPDLMERELEKFRKFAESLPLPE